MKRNALLPLLLLFFGIPRLLPAATPRMGTRELQPLISNPSLEGLYKRVQTNNDGPAVLLLVGGRPYSGNDMASLFIQAGAHPVLLNSTYLAGFGGSIKSFPTDKEEPTAEDGITPEFQRLDTYDLVFFNGIAPKKFADLLTKKRLAALRKFVQDGGHLLLTQNAPDAFKDLLPFTPAAFSMKGLRNLTVKRIVEDDRLALLPDQWPLTGSPRAIVPREGATVIYQIQDAEGKDICPYFLTMPYGNGTVGYLNTDYSGSGGWGVRQFYEWAYSRALLLAAANCTASWQLPLQGAVIRPAEKIAQTTREKASVNLQIPVMQLTDVKETPIIQENCARFPNGTILEVSPENGQVSIILSGAAAPYLRNLKAPDIVEAASQRTFDFSTAEALSMQEQPRRLGKIKWHFQHMQTEGNTIALYYTYRRSLRLKWSFKAGTLSLDGRKYDGIAQKAELLEAPENKFSYIRGGMDITLPGLFARRMNCYQSPRGYFEPLFTKGRASTTNAMGFFGDSQPFGYLLTEGGIYITFVEEPQVCTVCFSKGTDDEHIHSTYSFTVGRHTAPRVASAWLWELYSGTPEKGPNDYIAVWQFVRKHLRQAAGLKEYGPLPAATHTKNVTASERALNIETAAKLGFRLYELPLCPTAIENLASPGICQDLQKIRSCGITGHIWSPADYGHGKTEKVYQEHPEWYVRNENGDIFHYGGDLYPVLDINNGEFQAWYKQIVDKDIAAGMGSIYMDMGAACAGNINFAKDECDPGLTGLIKRFRDFHSKNVRCSIEGMNPLVLDSYWYRQKLYQPFAGREFAMLGASIGTNQGDDFHLDYFRTAMYNAYPTISTDGYACQFERVPDELAMVERIGRLLKGINHAIDNTETPFIRQTDFGTTWISRKGGAVFCWDGIKNLHLTLPSGYELDAIHFPDGTTGSLPEDVTIPHLQDLPPETILTIRNSKAER